MTSKLKQVYWDSCSWLGLINEEEEKVKSLKYVYQLAKDKKIEILTSTVSLAEVFKLKCEGKVKELPEEKDQLFEEFFNQSFIVQVAVTRDIGRLARRLLRKHHHEGLKWPQDAIHLASAAFYNVDELHTYDRNHLLPFNEKIDRRDGQKLKICNPPIPPVSPQGDLFEGQNDVLKEGELKLVINQENGSKAIEKNEKSQEKEKGAEGKEKPADVKG